MKKLFSTLMAVILLCASVAPCCTAAYLQVDDLADSQTVLSDDGGYEITELEVEDADSPTTSASTSSVTGSKTTTHYNAQGQRLFSYTLRAKFSYTGSTASVSTVSYSYRIYDSDWSLRSGSTRKSRNTAYGTGKFACGWSTSSVSLKITCSAKGALS